WKAANPDPRRHDLLIVLQLPSGCCIDGPVTDAVMTRNLLGTQESLNWRLSLGLLRMFVHIFNSHCSSKRDHFPNEEFIIIVNLFPMGSTLPRRYRQNLSSS